jgi:hypothetical protein
MLTATPSFGESAVAIVMLAVLIVSLVLALPFLLMLREPMLLELVGYTTQNDKG